MVDIKSRCGRILVIEARQIDVGTFQLLAAADGHRALSGRGRVRKKWGWAVHTGWLLPRQGAWSCGRLPRSIKCRSYDLQGLGWARVWDTACRNWRQLAWHSGSRGRREMKLRLGPAGEDTGARVHLDTMHHLGSLGSRQML